MCNNKDFFERQQVEMLLSAELAKPYQEMDPDFIKECSDFLLQMDGYHAAHSLSLIHISLQALRAALFHKARTLIQAAALDCRGAEILPRKAALARLVAE